MLDSLGKKMGAEDIRTVPQRQHDALEEACRRLLAAGTLPDRAGQPVQLQLHLSLGQLLNGIGTPGRPLAAARLRPAAARARASLHGGDGGDGRCCPGRTPGPAMTATPPWPRS